MKWPVQWHQLCLYIQAVGCTSGLLPPQGILNSPCSWVCYLPDFQSSDPSVFHHALEMKETGATDSDEGFIAALPCYIDSRVFQERSAVQCKDIHNRMVSAIICITNTRLSVRNPALSYMYMDCLHQKTRFGWHHFDFMAPSSGAYAAVSSKTTCTFFACVVMILHSHPLVVLSKQDIIAYTLEMMDEFSR